jgi:hypothetical protein
MYLEEQKKGRAGEQAAESVLSKPVHQGIMEKMGVRSGKATSEK